jgi:L-lysine 2,3-aminomutase
MSSSVSTHSTTDQLIVSTAQAAASWQKSLTELISSPAELLRLLGLDEHQLNLPADVLKRFPLRVPRPFVARMRHGDPDDPLLRQVLPSGKEGDDNPGFHADPLLETNFNPLPGMLHKYQGRVLLLAAPHCAVHCRYCFRRHFPYEDNIPGRRALEQSLQWLADRPHITEVIYSGGDPLAAGDNYLAWLTNRISEIPHISRLRIHTRTPVMIPERVDDALLAWISNTRLLTLMVIHSNHANEIDDSVACSMQKLKQVGVTLLNQSVLLRGVNDTTEALVALSERLFAVGVLPYYLHMLDKVQGVAHFEVSESDALQLMNNIRQQLPGYLVPRLVKEIPGEHSKTGLR